MAVVGLATICSEGGPRGDFDFEGGKVTFGVTYQVQTNDINDGPLIVCNAPGLPLLGSYWTYGNEFYAHCRLRHFSSPHRKSPGSLWWEIDLEYSSPQRKEGSGTKSDADGQFTNPLLELAEVTMSFDTVQQVITQIYNTSTGSLPPIKNSAGQTFVPAPTRDSARCILTISRNEAINANHPGLTIQYQSSCNSDIWWGQNPGVWLCMPITTTRQQKQLPNGTNYPYLKCQYTFHAKSPSHDLFLLDEGDYALDSTGTQVPFTDKLGGFIQGPLDGTGHALSGGSPVYIQVRQYPRQAFGPLNLPQSFQSAIQ